jgi:HK97 gp10 family phage protein
MKIKVTGHLELAKAIESLPREFQATAEYQVLGSGGKVIEKKAKANVVVGEGDLKKSIGTNIKGKPGKRTVRIGPKAGASKIVGVVSRGPNKGKAIKKSPNHYSHIVEYGTSRLPARPFLAPAVDQAASETLNAMAVGYEKAITRISKKINKGARR